MGAMADVPQKKCGGVLDVIFSGAFDLLRQFFTIGFIVPGYLLRGILTSQCYECLSSDID